MPGRFAVRALTAVLAVFPAAGAGVLRAVAADLPAALELAGRNDGKDIRNLNDRRAAAEPARGRGGLHVAPAARPPADVAIVAGGKRHGGEITEHGVFSFQY